MFSIFQNLIIIVLLHVVNARYDSLSKNHQFQNQNLILAEPSFDNKTLFYALFAKSTKQCNVIQDINPFTNSSVTKKCNFALKADKVQLIVSFGTEKAILISQEATSKSLQLKVITVHMTDCKTVEVELVEVPLNWTNYKLYRDYLDVVVFDHGFEVIIKGLSHLCTKPNAKVYCGSSFDVDGNKIEGPLIWPKMAYSEIDIVSPVMADASGQGYFFVNRDDSSLMAFQINRKGGPKYVKLWYTPTQNSNIWSYSVANKVDGMCYNINSTIGCWQTDREGEMKIQIEFEFDHQFKANIRQCNITKSTKIEEIPPPEIKEEDTTKEATTIQVTTVQPTTVKETTVAEITTVKVTTQETTTEAITTQESSVLDVTTESTIMVQETTEDDVMLPITVKGITVAEITTQSTTTQDDKTNDSTTAEDVTQDSVTPQDNSTESNLVQDSTTEGVTMQNNTAEDNVTESSATETIEDVTEDNTILGSATEDDNMEIITVQGLTTQAPATTETKMQENITAESTIQEVTTEGVTMQNITVQGLTIPEVENVTEKIAALKSMSQIKEITGEQKIWNLFIYNLRNGGLIILVVTCPNRICSGNEDHYYLMKINAQGKLYGQLEMNIKSKCNPEKNEVFAKVFENDQGQYCSVRLCKSKKGKEELLETLVNCYCNADFK